MTERYRLVFRGEVQQGQHPAVVKKRLGQALQLDADRLETLFSGKAVVVKREADTPTAARFQALFKKSGARLRVLPLDDTHPGSPDSPAQQSAVAGSEARVPGGGLDVAQAEFSNGPELLPPGSDVLRSEERRQVAVVEVDTSHLAVQGAVLAVHNEASPDAAPVPDVAHLSMADVGADLGDSSEPVEAPLDLAGLNFEVAEVGAVLDQSPRKPPPAAPDTSHLDVADPDAGD